MAMFLGGQSTQPEIDAIAKAFVPEAGKKLSHVDFAEMAGVEVGSNRFDTVSSRWRKIVERETGIRIESREGVFYLLTPEEAMDRASRDLHRIGRATGRLYVRIGYIPVDQLSDDSKAKHALMARAGHAMLEQARKSAKEVQGPKPVRSPNVRLAGQ